MRNPGSRSGQSKPIVLAKATRRTQDRVEAGDIPVYAVLQLGHGLAVEAAQGVLVTQALAEHCAYATCRTGVIKILIVPRCSGCHLSD